LQLPIDFGQEANTADAEAAAAADQSISDLGFAEHVDGNANVDVATDQRDLETLFDEDADNELLEDIADQLALSLLGLSE